MLKYDTRKIAGFFDSYTVFHYILLKDDLNILCVICKQVLFNLANQYAANEMYAEALNTYQVIVKNKMFSNAGVGERFFVHEYLWHISVVFIITLNNNSESHSGVELSFLEF